MSFCWHDWWKLTFSSLQIHLIWNLSCQHFGYDDESKPWDLRFIATLSQCLSVVTLLNILLYCRSYTVKSIWPQLLCDHQDKCDCLIYSWHSNADKIGKVKFMHKPVANMLSRSCTWSNLHFLLLTVQP